MLKSLLDQVPGPRGLHYSLTSHEVCQKSGYSTYGNFDQIGLDQLQVTGQT